VIDKEAVEIRRNEFTAHVWNHSVDPFQASFDYRRPLTLDELAALRRVVGSVAAGESDDAICELLRTESLRDSALVFILLQLGGLTRNKIITDLRAVTALRRNLIPSTPAQLPHRPEAWRLAGPYLTKWLRGVFEPLAGLDAKQLDGALEAVNQATWPGWIRQERAKRQGHEAEHRLAVLFAELRLPFAPAEKVDNPLGRDVLIHGVSFDLVVPSVSRCRLCVKSTVQTANIGQFGESKGDLEVRQASEMLRSNFPAEDRPLLLAMVDGVGFRSNRAGLDGILEVADEFCQFATVWKAAVLAARLAGVDLQVYLPSGDDARHNSFLKRHSVMVGPLDERTRAQLISAHAVEAGEALIVRAR
jgi:hypothetical protein